MTGLVDRVCSALVCRAVETEGALLFLLLVEIEKAFKVVLYKCYYIIS